MWCALSSIVSNNKRMNMGTTFDTNTIRLINLFENVTKAAVKDCYVDDSNHVVYFIVNEGDIGLAIGKNGSAVKNVEMMIKKNIRIFEFSNDLSTFVKNIIPAANKIEVRTGEDGTVVEIGVMKQDKALVIGRDGRNINLYRELLQRNHDVQKLLVK